jgi:hypothetical protein
MRKQRLTEALKVICTRPSSWKVAEVRCEPWQSASVLSLFKNLLSLQVASYLELSVPSLLQNDHLVFLSGDHSRPVSLLAFLPLDRTQTNHLAHGSRLRIHDPGSPSHFLPGTACDSCTCWRLCLSRSSRELKKRTEACGGSTRIGVTCYHEWTS